MPSEAEHRSVSILIPAARMGASEEDAQTVWGDVRVALASIAAYAPGVDVVLAWNGREEPRDLPPNPHVRLVKQIEGIRTASAAWNFAATQTDADELLILGDDCVLLPDSLPLLFDDLATIHASQPEGGKVGIVGTRSNFVSGPQNIREANGGERAGIRFDSEARIFAVEMIVPVAAWVRHDVFDSVGGFPNTNWFGDDLLSFDLQNAGYTHYVSRAYVHHVGQRATGEGKSDQQLYDEGMAWLAEHRPDFLRARLGTS
ncbi:MAG: hypothetical protein AAGC46_11950 [Solirubrobacteraceae bacterium]|nr:hypothetical protein [Patulibacter sp.]